MSLVVPLEEVFANRTGLLANHESWARINLGEVCSILNGFPFKSTLFNKSEGMPVIRIRDIAKGVTETFYDGDVLPEYIVRNGDLLIGMDGNFRCCEWQGRDAALNQRVCKLTPNELILHRKFLLYGLNGYLKAIEDVTSSVTVGHLSSRDIQQIPFPLPSLNEQRRIVAKVEAVLGKVDASQQRLAKIPVLVKRFRQSVLAAACSGRLTADWREEHTNAEASEALLQKMQTERPERCLAANANRKYREPEPLAAEDLPDIPPSWLWTNFDRCCWEITVGHVGPMKDRYVEQGVRFLRSQNVRPLRFDAAGLVCIPRDFHAALSKSRLQGGELLVTRSGANTGDCCVFPRDRGEANCADLVIARPLSGLCAEYGAIYVCSPTGQARLSLNETGIAQPHFNIGAMRVKAFPLPPLAEQQEIVRRVESVFSLADQLEARLANAKVQVDKLTPSLLARAFRGELVPTEAELANQMGRSYESASALLERIRGDRASGGDERPRKPARRTRGAG
jgi:type I restriction enzyme S subunit